MIRIDIRPIVALICMTLALALAAQSPGSAPGKKALVIGNAAYTTGPLKNPVNDAVDLAAVLKGIGFTVQLLTDVPLEEMRDAVDAFGTSLKPGDTGLFYFSGHGLQIEGKNYLIPVNMKVATGSQVKNRSLVMDEVLSAMQGAGNKANIVILDACRDNPFPVETKTLKRGLSVVGSQPPGSLILYATSADSTASDGSGRNGLFTESLLKYLGQKESFDTVVKRTATDVQKASGGGQVPAIYSQLFEDVYLAGQPEKRAEEPRIVTVYQRAPTDAVVSAIRAFSAEDLRASMVPIPGGKLTWYRTSAELDAYELSACAVTQAQYTAVMGKNTSFFEGPDRPVESVAFSDAAEFCNKLSDLHGYRHAYEIKAGKIDWILSADGYRLPTSAERYWASTSAGTDTKAYPGSNSPNDVGWYKSNSLDETHPVAQKKPTAQGIFDLFGNVNEWVWDIPRSDSVNDFATEPLADPQPTNPRGPIPAKGDSSAVSSRTRMGASFDYSYSRFDPRRGDASKDPSKYIGFRVARWKDVPPPERLRSKSEAIAFQNASFESEARAKLGNPKNDSHNMELYRRTDPATGAIVIGLYGSYIKNIVELVLDSTGTIIKVRNIRDVFSGIPEKILEMGGYPSLYDVPLAFSDTPFRMAFAPDQRIIIYDFAKKKIVKITGPLGSPLYSRETKNSKKYNFLKASMAFSRDGKYLVSVPVDWEVDPVRLYQAETGRMVEEYLPDKWDAHRIYHGSACHFRFNESDALVCSFGGYYGEGVYYEDHYIRSAFSGGRMTIRKDPGFLDLDRESYNSMMKQLSLPGLRIDIEKDACKVYDEKSGFMTQFSLIDLPSKK